MKSLKKVLFFTIIVLATLTTAAVFLYKKNNSENVPVSQQPSKKTPAESDKIIIPTQQGDVVINNIEKNPVQGVPFDGSVLFRRSGNYDMYYYPPDNGFVITLMNPDLESARSAAEKDFVETLGISKEQACFLKVTLNVPFSVSEKVSGKNYGLSFCPEGKPFSEN